MALSVRPPIRALKVGRLNAVPLPSSLFLWQGDWKVGAGWRDSKIGYFYGGATVQGLLPYYYNEVAPGTAMEINR